MLQQIRNFVQPFYQTKDIMHDMSHLDRIKIVLNDLANHVDFSFDKNIAEAALYFHGIIYSDEEKVIQFLNKTGVEKDKIDFIVKAAWESQKEHQPTTNEGLILYDAHMLEGGKNFEIIKSLITGSVRGQSLEETMVYIETHLLEKGHCYTEEGKRRYEEMKRTTLKIYRELNEGLGRNPITQS